MDPLRPGSDRLTPTPGKVPQLEVSFNHLAESFAHLKDRVERLKHRLNPIMGNDVPTNDGAKDRPQTEPHRFSHKLEMLTDGVRGITSEVDDMLSRLEI